MPKGTTKLIKIIISYSIFSQLITLEIKEIRRLLLNDIDFKAYNNIILNLFLILGRRYAYFPTRTRM